MSEQTLGDRRVRANCHSDLLEQHDAELKVQRKIIKRLRGEIESWKALVSQHEAEIERLRGALNAVGTPILFRSDIIEECARKIAVLFRGNSAEPNDYNTALADAAAAIRELKDKTP